MIRDFEFPDAFPKREDLLRDIQYTITKAWALNIPEGEVLKWLGNFRGDVFEKEHEQRLALWLLNNYTYYNKDDVTHLCKTAYNKFTHHFLSIKNIIEDEKIKESLKSIQYSPIGLLSESGSMLAYFIRQEAEMSKYRFIDRSKLKHDAPIVFVDDVTLSGNTIIKTLEYDGYLQNHSENVFIITLIASNTAIKKLKEKGVDVICSYEATERDRCFSMDSVAFYKFRGLKEYAKIMAKEYGKKINPDMPLGYDAGEYCFGFFYNTPNNTLPIFWKKSKDWHPLFERKEKLNHDVDREQNYI